MTLAVRFADGTVERGFRLVVGADRAWSKTRALVHAAEPVYAGVSQLQYGISKDNPIYSRVGDFCRKGSYIAMNNGNTLYVQRQTDGEYIVYVARHAAENWRLTSGGKLAFEEPEKFISHLLATSFAGWSPGLQEIVRHSEGPHRIWTLYSHPVESIGWDTVPGVTLIGDAAHLSLLSGARGVNVGMHDALELSRAIADCGLDHIDEAVRRYEKTMFPRTKEHIQGGDFIRSVMFASDSPRGFREWTASMQAKRTEMET